MDGIFMRKLLTRFLVCLCIAAFVWSWILIRDRQMLRENLIRFHVVANSDSESDQTMKLKVRDAVLSNIREDMASISDVEEAKMYLQENLPKIQDIANRTLQRYGFDEQAFVSLCKEAFDTRNYDTFSLPAGIYESLRIVIGEGNGKNWWCITFPDLCLPASSAGFEEQAVSAGFSEGISSTLSGKPKYQIRFFLLDALGKAETKLWPEK